MALNRKTFQTRALTAIIFAVVMLTGLLWNQWSFLLLFSVIHFGCWWEYLKIIEKVRKTVFHIYIKLGLMTLGYGIMLLFCASSFQIQGYGLKENLSLPVSCAGFAILVIGIFQKLAVQPKALAVAALGFLYISLPWGLMLVLNRYSVQDVYGASVVDVKYLAGLPVFVIATIWINDTMAYIVGSLIGKTPLSKISPKKTWEGTVGGIILAVAVAALVAYLLKFNWLQFSVTTLIIAVTGTFGDLLESKLKRMANIKDSGSFMPGHGGFLDRFDSMLLATPLAWLYIFECLK